ncbi:hypothetical protein ROE7235_00569 [Roseibaca ekhonensis]|uniref:Uncharacterized protein n=1 Tax=Roseinatronobacter ekhonensis TaxID=254356 RepID=A0A3B0M5Y4_9RHOB|nr:hypothetical protein ROE7235_00569 [Roseibaca ekhonensis]
MLYQWLHASGLPGSSRCSCFEGLAQDNERLTWSGKLDGLFRSPIFQEQLDEAGDPMFWASLISVRMGLRSEEILQLYVSDIQIIDDVPCIALRHRSGRQTLRASCIRRIIARLGRKVDASGPGHSAQRSFIKMARTARRCCADHANSQYCRSELHAAVDQPLRRNAGLRNLQHLTQSA